MKTLVGPEKRIKNNDLYGLCKKFRKGVATEKQIKLIQSVTDVDYLMDIRKNEEARVFMADFLCEWFACDNQLRTKETEAMRRARLRDVTSTFKQVDINVDSDGIMVEDIGSVAAVLGQSSEYATGANPAHIPDPNKNYKSNYSLRDYTPSLRFNPDAIIDAIDRQRQKAKLKKGMR